MFIYQSSFRWEWLNVNQRISYIGCRHHNLYMNVYNMDEHVSSVSSHYFMSFNIFEFIYLFSYQVPGRFLFDILILKSGMVFFITFYLIFFLLWQTFGLLKRVDWPFFHDFFIIRFLWIQFYLDCLLMKFIEPRVRAFWSHLIDFLSTISGKCACLSIKLLCFKMKVQSFRKEFQYSFVIYKFILIRLFCFKVLTKC